MPVTNSDHQVDHAKLRQNLARLFEKEERSKKGPKPPQTQVKSNGVQPKHTATFKGDPPKMNGNVPKAPADRQTNGPSKVTPQNNNAKSSKNAKNAKKNDKNEGPVKVAPKDKVKQNGNKQNGQPAAKKPQQKEIKGPNKQNLKPALKTPSPQESKPKKKAVVNQGASEQKPKPKPSEKISKSLNGQNTTEEAKKKPKKQNTEKVQPKQKPSVESSVPVKKEKAEAKKKNVKAKVPSPPVPSTPPPLSKKKKKNKTKDNGTVNGEVGDLKLKRAAPSKAEHQPLVKKPKKTLQDLLDEPYVSYEDTDFELSESEKSVENAIEEADDDDMSHDGFDESDDDEDDYGQGEHSSEWSSDDDDIHYEETDDSEGIDEDDYEGTDEDRFEWQSDENDYDTDSDDDDAFDDDGEDSSYFHGGDCDDDDFDYKLPDGEVEDHIIHKGTAEWNPFQQESHDVTFDSDSEEAQIKELPQADSTIAVEQPEAYAREALMVLNIEHTTKFGCKALKAPSAVVPSKNKAKHDAVGDNDGCPQLVPIVDEDGFQLYDPNLDSEEDSDGDEEELGEEEEDSGSEEDDWGSEEEDWGSEISLGSCEECSDDDSLGSEDINAKYLSSDDDDDSEEEVDMTVEVIKSKGKRLPQKFPRPEGVEEAMREPQVGAEHWTGCKKASVEAADLGLSPKEEESNKEVLEEAYNTSLLEETSNTSLLDSSSGNSSPEAPADVSIPLGEIEASSDLKEAEEKAIERERVRANRAYEREYRLQQQQLEEKKTKKQTSQPSEDTQFGTFFYNAVDANDVLVLLRRPFCLYGTVKVEVLLGGLEVFGYEAGPGEQLQIFSPRGCSYVTLTATQPPDSAEPPTAVKKVLKRFAPHFLSKDLQHIEQYFNATSDSLLLLRRNERCKKMLSTLKRHMNENVFPNVEVLSMERPHYASEYLLGCMVCSDGSERQLEVLPLWRSVELRAGSRVVLAGGKSVGKSTLVRYLINRHVRQLGRVLLIDLDIGQSELFVPQTVSCFVVDEPLLGPGFFLNRQPRHALLVGNINPVLSPDAYLEAVRRLIVTCLEDEELRALPWLVNTMGYNKGFGLELMAWIRQLVRPTDIVQLQSHKKINNYDVLLKANELSRVPAAIYPERGEANGDYRLHVWRSLAPQESRYQRSWTMSAKDLRYVTLLVRLSDALQGNAESLNDSEPLSAPLSSVRLISTSDAELSTAELVKSMQAALVYLCKAPREDTNQPLTCVGIGVTRAIDGIHQAIYLHPAMPLECVSPVNCLAITEIALPTTFLMRQGLRVSDSAPFLYNAVVGKSTKSVKQIYHRPEAFLQGKHRNLLN